MTNSIQSPDPVGRKMRKTLRLTFRVVGGEVRLLSRERLEMICPPSIGERPEAGKHSGYWIEMRDGQGRLLFHRTLDFPFGNSVEVHSPDGKIRREFGPGRDNLFEVLVPDESDAKYIVLMGEPPEAGKAAAAPASRELVQFDLTASIPPGGAAGEKR